QRGGGGLLERRRVKSRCGMRLVMLAEGHLALVAVEPLADVVGHPQLLAEPQRHGHEVRLPPAWRARGVRFEKAIELHERLLVEADVIEVLRRDARLAQTVVDRTGREPRVVLPPRDRKSTRLNS